MPGQDEEEFLFIFSPQKCTTVCVLHASMWNRDPGHRSGGGGQDTDRHLRHLCVGWCSGHCCGVKILGPECVCVCVATMLVQGFCFVFNSTAVLWWKKRPRGGSRLWGSLGRSSGNRIRVAFGSATICGSMFSGDCAKPGSGPPPLSATLWGW